MERIRWAVVADVPWAGPCPGHQVPANASLKASDSTQRGGD